MKSLSSHLFYILMCLAETAFPSEPGDHIYLISQFHELAKEKGLNTEGDHSMASRRFRNIFCYFIASQSGEVSPVVFISAVGCCGTEGAKGT